MSDGGDHPSSRRRACRCVGCQNVDPETHGLGPLGPRFRGDERREYTRLPWGLPCLTLWIGARLRLFQLRRGARQHLDHLRFRLVVVVATLGGDPAQVLDRRAHERRHAAAVVVVAAEAAAHARNPLADEGQPLEHRVDEVAVLVEMGAALVGDGVALLGALDLGGDVAGLFEIGQRRIDDAGARRVPAGGLVFEHLDDLVAVARLLGDQRKRDQAQVALRQHAPGAHHIAAAVTSAPAVAGAELPAPTAAAAPLPTAMSHAEHVGFLGCLRYIARYTKDRCSARYIFYRRKHLSLLANIPMMSQKICVRGRRRGRHFREFAARCSTSAQWANDVMSLKVSKSTPSFFPVGRPCLRSASAFSMARATRKMSEVGYATMAKPRR